MLVPALALHLLSPRAADAGWYARQVDKSSQEAAEIYYEGGKVRIDQGKNTSVIYNLSIGEIVMINHLDKSYIKQTLEELAEVRNKMIVNLRQQLSQFPAEKRAELSAKIDQMEKGATEDVKPVATGNKDKVGKFSCEVYRWKGNEAEGEVCIAKDVGVSLADFAAHAQKLSEKMKALKLANPQGGGSLAMLDMAKTGFPVRTKSKVTLGPDQTIESSFEVDEIRAMSVPTDKLSIPKGYAVKQMPGIPLGPPPESGVAPTPKK
jgi:hypothetical protein